MSKNKMSKKQFVEDILSKTISIASGRGYIGDDEKEKGWVDHLSFNEKTEEVTIHCKNGHLYWVNVCGDSHSAIIEDVIRVVLRHS